MKNPVKLRIELPNAAADLQALHVVVEGLKMLGEVDELPAQMAGLAWIREICKARQKEVAQAALDQTKDEV